MKYKVDKKNKLEELNINFDIEIPIDSKKITEDNLYIEKILIERILYNLKQIIISYKQSELPNKFLKDQNLIITNKLRENEYGKFVFLTDDIYLDVNSLNGLSELKKEFIFAYEMGFKILKYKKNLLYDLASPLGLTYEENKELLSKVFAFECGNIVCNSNISPFYLREPIPTPKNEYMKRLILNNLYRG